MSKSGLPNEQAQPQAAPLNGVTWAFIVGAVAFVLFALWLAFRLSAPLSGLLFPPEPPIPSGATLQRQATSGYGADSRVYHLPPLPCPVRDFYAEQGQCVTQDGHCEQDSTPKRDALTATCQGNMVFGGFTMYWDVEIYDYPQQTEVLLNREIYWLPHTA
ncbi:MAG: hypothetical protein ACOYL5_04660, partial [Phototrophicaceae bacterium]